MINIELLKKHVEQKMNDYNKNTNTIVNTNTNTNIITNKEIDTNNYKIQKILGDNFKCIFEKINNIYYFKFTNESKILNIDKSKYIDEKINQLLLNGFFEVENLKISNIGRFLVIEIKTIDYYMNKKEILKKEYLDNINLIDFKINMIKNNNK